MTMLRREAIVILHLARSNGTNRMAVGLSLFLTASYVAWPSSFGLLMGLGLAIPLLRFVYQRPSLFEAALPVTGRHVYLSRISSAAALLGSPAVVALVASLLRGGSDIRLSLWFQVVVSTILLILLPYAVRPSEISEPPAPILIGALGTAAAGSALAIYFLTPTASVVALGLSAIALFTWTWHAIPASPQVAPRTRLATIVPRKGDSERRWFTSTVVPESMPLFRSAVSRTAVMYFALMTMMGFASMPLIYVLIFFGPLLDGNRARIRWMSALPISPRKLLLTILLPAVVAVPGGLFVGSHIQWNRFTVGERLTRNAPDVYVPGVFFNNRTNVALQFWQRAADRAQPNITAPWGETRAADTLSIFGSTYYNPFTIGEKSSEAFVEWQFGRATTAVYGRPYTIAEYEANRRARRVRVTDSARMQVLSGAALLVLVLGIALFGELAQQPRISRMRRGGLIAAAIKLAPTAVLASVDLYYDFRHGTGVLAPLAQALLLKASVALGSIAMVLLVATLSVVALYLLVEWQFRRSDAAGSLRVVRARH
ncbi:MAG: hypothetical protein V4550_11925 [Gemmatimonadota bacterium]